MKEEDLIGTIWKCWKCWRCGEEEIVTKDGVLHSSIEKGSHWANWSLNDLFVIKEMEEGFNRQLLYGKEEYVHRGTSR